MNVTLSHVVGACISMVIWFGVGWTYGGVYWIPFGIMCVPLAVVGVGYVLGRMFGGIDDVRTVDDAVGKAMESHADRKEDRNDE